MKVFDHDVFTYPGDNFLVDWVEKIVIIILLEEILDYQDNLDFADIPEP